MVLNSDGEPLRTTTDTKTTQQYAELVPNLAGMARSLVRDLDPQNDLQFLRLQTKQHEIMVYADKDFSLIVVQEPDAGSSNNSPTRLHSNHHQQQQQEQ
jgi:dynein light chain roadblock-type